MNFNVLQLISSTKELIACKRIKNNCFDKFRQNEEKKRGKPKQSFMYNERPLGSPQNNSQISSSPVSTQSNQSWLHFVFASTVGGLLQTSFIIYNGEDRCFPLQNHYLGYSCSSKKNKTERNCCASCSWCEKQRFRHSWKETA